MVALLSPRVPRPRIWEGGSTVPTGGVVVAGAGVLVWASAPLVALAPGSGSAGELEQAPRASEATTKLVR